MSEPQPYKRRLAFTPGNHSYRLDRRRIPGVTGILKKGLDKPALVNWAARTVAEFVANEPSLVDLVNEKGGPGPTAAMLAAIPNQRRDTAAIRGTDVHALAERVIHGEAVEVPDHLHAHVDGYVRWLDAFDVHPVLTEQRVASERYWYAGTFDLIADIGGTRWGLDIKTSSRIYGETALQCAAYFTADWWEDDEGTHPIPQVERVGVVHVTDGGTVLFPLLNGAEEVDKAAGLFRHISYVVKHLDWIKDRVGTPIEEPAHV